MGGIVGGMSGLVVGLLGGGYAYVKKRKRARKQNPPPVPSASPKDSNVEITLDGGKKDVV